MLPVIILFNVILLIIFIISMRNVGKLRTAIEEVKNNQGNVTVTAGSSKGLITMEQVKTEINNQLSNLPPLNKHSHSVGAVSTKEEGDEVTLRAFDDTLSGGNLTNKSSPIGVVLSKKKW